MTLCNVLARRGFAYTWWELSWENFFQLGSYFYCHFSLIQFCPPTPLFFTDEKTGSLREEGTCPMICLGSWLLAQIWGGGGGEREVGEASELRQTWWPPGGHFRKSPRNSRSLRPERDWIGCIRQFCLCTWKPKLEAPDDGAVSWLCLFLVNLVIACIGSNECYANLFSLGKKKASHYSFYLGLMEMGKETDIHYIHLASNMSQGEIR